MEMFLKISSCWDQLNRSDSFFWSAYKIGPIRLSFFIMLGSFRVTQACLVYKRYGMWVHHPPSHKTNVFFWCFAPLSKDKRQEAENQTSDLIGTSRIRPEVYPTHPKCILLLAFKKDSFTNFLNKLSWTKRLARFWISPLLAHGLPLSASQQFSEKLAENLATTYKPCLTQYSPSSFMSYTPRHHVMQRCQIGLLFEPSLRSPS